MSRSVEFTEQVEKDYMNYARHIALARAIPDARDGLKPVHRRVLYAMYELGILPKTPHKKSARVVGHVLGIYHPHGDASVYDALVRLAQPFSCNIPLVDGQGNFGSIDGASPAAMRYTEARLSGLATQVLVDLAPDTTLYIPNFDDSTTEPAVLPSRVPLLLLNGTEGIAAGYKTNIPPHNLIEVCEAAIHLAKKWGNRDAVTVDDLMQYVQGPDFPTGGVIFRYRDGKDVFRQMYETGRGNPLLQMMFRIEPIAGGKHNIVVSEIPYLAKKENLIASVASKVRDGKVVGVSDLNDESDRTGMRIVIEVGRGQNPQEVVNALLNYTELRTTSSMIAYALADSSGAPPELMGLKRMLEIFVDMRLSTIYKRAVAEHARLSKRLHIVDGLITAFAHIDEIIAIIRQSKDRNAAGAELQRRFGISDEQAKAILAMQVGSLSNLDQVALQKEAGQLRKDIERQDALIQSEGERVKLFVQETKAIMTEFGTPRRTRIVDHEVTTSKPAAVDANHFIKPKLLSLVVGKPTLTEVDAPPAKGIHRQWLQPPDAIALLTDSTGMMAYAPLNDNTMPMITGMSNVIGGGYINGDGGEGKVVVIVTGTGRVKTTNIADLRLRTDALAPIVGLKDGDYVAHCSIAPADGDLFIATKQGKALRTSLANVNPQASGTATGVAGIILAEDDAIVSVVTMPRTTDGVQGWVVVFSELGYAKRTPLSEFAHKGRGTGGMECLRPTSATGNVAAVGVFPSEATECRIMDRSGNGATIPLADLPEVARAPRGNKTEYTNVVVVF
jgi:DNA gyrase subunit A